MKQMIRRIHILGASGSGTTTLAQEISKKFNFKHFDTDDFYWIKTNPPFTQKREIEKRISYLSDALQSADKWVLSGSLCSWGDDFVPFFDLVVYLWIPHEIRMSRLTAREAQRYGADSIKSGGLMYESHREFMEWASNYDSGGINMRSKQRHESWLKTMQCKILKIEGDIELKEKIQQVEKIILNSQSD